MSDNNAWPVAKRTEEITYAVRDIILVADQAKAAGKDMIYLNIGDPNIYDFDTPPELIDAACEAMRNNKNGYAPSPGIPSALDAIRADAERKGVKSVRDVFTSYGASEAIETCLAALADPGDNIIIPSPGYPLYAALNSKLNLQSKFYPLNEDNDWQPDVEYIGKCIDERTKAIVLINPNNPTGAVYNREVLLGIIELARKHRLVIFSDEIYDRLIFDGNKHIPTASLADDVPIVTFNGLSKCYLSPGWRIGWAVISGPQHIQSYIEAMQKMVRARLCINHPLQYAIPVALEGEHKHLPPAIKKLQERRDIVCDRLNKITGISCVKPKGTFYVFPKIEIDVADDKFIKELVLETGVVLVPGSGFGKLASAGHFRLVFLPEPEILEKACSNIENFMQKYLKTQQNPFSTGPSMEYKLLYSPEKLSSIKSEKQSSAEEKWEIGNTIENKYEIQEILAEDDKKIIYKVRHCQWNIHLAVRTQLKKEEQARFFSQAERWVNLEKHPNIVSAYYTKTTEDVSRLFVEYVRAKTLVNFRSQANLDVETILDVAIQLGWGMNHAHSKGLLHGDLRPGNIFITDDYKVKISDFRLREEVGTYTPYMAPEQFDENAPLQHTVDMYAYGVVLYEMCLGELPFKLPGKNLQANNIEKYKTVAMTQPPRNPSQVLISIPKEFSQIIMSCISPNPEDRPRDFALINETLTNLYEDFTGFDYPRQEPEHSTLMAIDLNNRALALLDLGEEEKAEQYLQDAVESDPACAGAVINFELLRLRKRKNTIAHVLNKTAALLEADPQVIAYYRAKICLEYGGFLEEALGELEFILHDYPRNKELLNLKSSFLERLGKYEEAISVLETFINSENSSAKDHFNLGKCYLYLRKFKSAQEAFEKGCELFDTNRALKLGLGLAMAHRGKVKEAQEHFEKMVEEKDNDFWPLLQLAEITSAISKYIKVYGKATQDYTKGKALYDKLWEQGAVPRVKHGYELTHGAPPTTKGIPITDRSNWRYSRSLAGHDKGVHCIAISPDDRFAVAAGDTPQIFVWDIATGKTKKIFETDGERITDLRISHDGHFAISISDGNIVDVWDLIANQRVCQLEGHVSHITCLEMTKTGYIATGSVDKTIRIWDLGGLVCHKVLKGHKDKVLCVAVTPCGKKVFSGGEDHSVGIWNIESGECLGIFEGHKDGVNCIVVSPNGKYAVSASWDQTLRVWDVESCQCLQVLEGHSGIINSVVISADSIKVISAGEDKNILIWNIETGDCINSLEGHAVSVTCLKIGEQTQTIVSGSWDHTIKMWDMDSGECLNSLEGHTDLVNAIAMTKDESYMLSGGDDPVLRVWKDITTEMCPYFKEPPLSYMIESPKLQSFGNILEQRLIGKLFTKAQQHIKEGNVARSFELFREIQEMKEFEKNNRILEVIASTAIQNNFKRNKTRKIWSPRTLSPHKNALSVFATTAENDILAAASYDGSISLWNVEEMKKIDVLKGHSDYITSMDISSNKRFLISGSRDKTIRLWELQTGQCIYSLSGHKHWVEKVKFSDDGRKIISGSRDGTIAIWETKSGDVVHNLTNHTDIINNLEILPQKEQIISTSHDRSIRIWDIETGKCLYTLERHREHVSCIAIVPNSPYMVSGGWDHVLYLWNLEDGSFVRKFSGHSSWINTIGVSHDGKTIVSASLDKTIRVWELDTGECRGVLENHQDDVTQILITPDDRFAISASYDNSILVWDIMNCECCDGVSTNNGRIKTLIMLEEGRRVLSGTAEGKIGIWEIDWEWEIPYEYEQIADKTANSQLFIYTLVRKRNLDGLR